MEMTVINSHFPTITYCPCWNLEPSTSTINSSEFIQDLHNLDNDDCLIFHRRVDDSFRCSVTAITSRFHRGDRGSTPRIGASFLQPFGSLCNNLIALRLCVSDNS